MTGDDWLEEVFRPALRTGNPPVQELRGALRALAACGVLEEAVAARAADELGEFKTLRAPSRYLRRPGYALCFGPDVDRRPPSLANRLDIRARSAAHRHPAHDHPRGRRLRATVPRPSATSAKPEPVRRSETAEPCPARHGRSSRPADATLPLSATGSRGDGTRSRAKAIAMQPGGWPLRIAAAAATGRASSASGDARERTGMNARRARYPRRCQVKP
jgi:hypothetical protein